MGLLMIQAHPTQEKNQRGAFLGRSEIGEGEGDENDVALPISRQPAASPRLPGGR